MIEPTNLRKGKWNLLNRKERTQVSTLVEIRKTGRLSDRPPNRNQLKIVPTKHHGHMNTPKQSAKAEPYNIRKGKKK